MRCAVDSRPHPSLRWHSRFKNRVLEVKVLANPSELTSPRNLFQIIATDIHFWIPFAVLVGGLLLLDKLR